MSRFLGHCLVFSGVCLLAAASLSTAGWLACMRSQGNCEAPLATAVTAWTGAANVALGVALQERQP